MSINKNALIRYKTIDACLQNRYRKWTLENLIDACSEALYEYEGVRNGVSRRTVQLDLQLMRSDKLGYNAPIMVSEKKYYTYEDPKYSIANIPLTGQDLGTLSEVVTILKQFKGFSHFREVNDMIGRLQHKIDSGRGQQRAVIEFEKNEHLTGLEWIDPLYQAIIDRNALQVSYQSFRTNKAQSFIFYPHLLKEFRNRWFLLGMRENLTTPQLLALDRIKAIDISTEIRFREEPGLDASYFEDIIGVTRHIGQRPQAVRFRVLPATAPYVLTKPFHRSQQELGKLPDGSMLFEIRVDLNFELERELLGFGEDLEVLSPPGLRRRIATRLEQACARYAGEEEA